MPNDRNAPLTTGHFDEVMTALGKTLNDHTKRLERIESHLWNQQRFEEHERRLIALAETVGRADLATPFNKPLGA
jgi:hypothetical protein